MRRASKGELRDALRLAMTALKQAKLMNDNALPKFNWGASFLDAEAISLLNDSPMIVRGAIARIAAIQEMDK